MIWNLKRLERILERFLSEKYLKKGFEAKKINICALQDGDHIKNSLWYISSSHPPVRSIGSGDCCLDYRLHDKDLKKVSYNFLGYAQLIIC